MNWITQATKAVWSVLKDLPRWLLVIIRTPTGKRLVVSAVVSALAAVGVNAPFEAVKEILDALLGQLGAGPMDSSAVITATILAPLVDAAFRANDTVEDLKREKSGVMAVIPVSPDDPDALKVVLVGNRLHHAIHYDWHKTDGFRVVTEAGPVPMGQADLRNTALQDLYYQLRMKAYAKRV